MRNKIFFIMLASLVIFVLPMSASAFEIAIDAADILIEFEASSSLEIGQISHSIELSYVIPAESVDTFTRLGLSVEFISHVLSDTISRTERHVPGYFHVSKTNADIATITESDLEFLINAFVSLYNNMGVRISSWDMNFANALMDAGLFQNFIEGKRVVYASAVQAVLEDLAKLSVEELYEYGWIYALSRRDLLEPFAELYAIANPYSETIMPLMVHGVIPPNTSLLNPRIWRSGFPLLPGDHVMYTVFFDRSIVNTGLARTWGGAAILGNYFTWHTSSPGQRWIAVNTSDVRFAVACLTLSPQDIRISGYYRVVW
ncbi:MAG: hypothetical protein FWF81_11785 [Defluviitaleaceae bacterium]|nr:hypothetical protein [Defluviitaleaceae bacterium]